jgi:TRAP-type uncharacterized transport system substrate-binding protein
VLIRVLLVFGALAAATLTAALLVSLLDILPPDGLRFAAGRQGGGYHAVAERYRAALARDGVSVEIVETAGSTENARLLAEGAADVALLQGGVDPPAGAEVEALAAVFVEPLLVFHRRTLLDATDPAAWRGLRVAAGEPDSGARAAVDAMIEALALEIPDEALQPLGGGAAAQALLDEAVDVAVFVAPIEAPYLAPLLTAQGIALAPIRDTQALARRLAFVRMVDIPAAGLDYARRLPPEAIPLPGMVARLAARADLHPALVDRLATAALQVHHGPSLLSDSLRFPSTDGVAMPLNAHAASLLEDGPGPLAGLLPYWANAQISRLALALLPLLVVLVPLIRAAPALYAWRMRSRVDRRYDELIAIDGELDAGMEAGRAEALHRRLVAMEAEARRIKLPPRFRPNLYTLRLHIELVRDRLTEARDAPSRD